MTDFTKGYGVLFLVLIMISFDAVTVRFTGIDGLSVAFWRNGGIALCMFFIAVYSYGLDGILKHIRQMSLKQGMACLLFGVSGTFFSLAVQETSVVNVLLMFVLSPLFAIFMSSIFLKERISNVLKFSSVFVVGGTAFAYKDSFDMGWI